MELCAIAHTTDNFLITIKHMLELLDIFTRKLENDLNRIIQREREREIDRTENEKSGGSKDVVWNNAMYC